MTRVYSKRYGITSINSSYDGTNISCDACNEAGCSIKSTKTLLMRRQFYLEKYLTVYKKIKVVRTMRNKKRIRYNMKYL